MFFHSILVAMYFFLHAFAILKTLELISNLCLFNVNLNIGRLHYSVYLEHLK
jgi:hypothetical protein